MVRSSTRHPSRVRHLVLEVARFLTVGGLATLVSVVGFNALAHGLLWGRAPLAQQPLLAYVMANGVAGLLAYAGLRAWAFRDREGGDSLEGVLRFFGLGVATMAIPVLCLWFSRYVLGLTSPLADNLSANVVGLTAGTIARFWMFRRFVFDTPARASAGGDW